MARFPLAIAAGLLICSAAPALAQTGSPDKPTWWEKYQYLAAHGPDTCTGQPSLKVGPNVNVSNECGPQSETFVTIDPSQPARLAGGSNEIFRLPMRGYFSSDGGASWGGVDLPLPPAKGNGFDFGSDPSLAFDSRGNVFYGYIVVFFGNGNGINGTAVGVARSSDGGRTYPQFTLFSQEGGSEHFNDKPMIAADSNPASPFRDNVYIAWDAAVGGSPGGGVRVARSTDHGATFTSLASTIRADRDARSAPSRSSGRTARSTSPGTTIAANTIAFNRSLDGGATWGAAGGRRRQAHAVRHRDSGGVQPRRARLSLVRCRSLGRCAPRPPGLLVDGPDAARNTDIFVSYSDDRGGRGRRRRRATDALGGVDRFNHWLSVDPVTGDVNVSFYDTRNDTTGARFMTDIYFSQSRTGGASWLPNVRVTDVSSNEHDCDGVFPCDGIDYGNQTGDYAGLVSYGGVSHPIWTDSRRQLAALPGCRTALAMEEVFSATVTVKR